MSQGGCAFLGASQEEAGKGRTLSGPRPAALGSPDVAVSPPTPPGSPQGLSGAVAGLSLGFLQNSGFLLL